MPSLAQRSAVSLIRLYQKTLSPDHGILASGLSGCRYYPSCSEYSARAIARYGVLRGVGKGLWRIVRCNPWAAGGVDELV